MGIEGIAANIGTESYERASMNTKKKVDARVTKTRAAVLDAATHLLFEEGWNVVTHVRVAAKSGVARATIYRHWPTVEDLLADVILGHPSPNPGGQLTGDTRGDLNRELNTFVAQLQKSKLHEIIVTAMERASVGHPRMREMHRAITRISRKPVWNIVSSGIAAGELNSTLTEVTTAAHTLGPVLYLRLICSKHVKPQDVAIIVDAFLFSFTCNHEGQHAR